MTPICAMTRIVTVLENHRSTVPQRLKINLQEKRRAVCVARRGLEYEGKFELIHITIAAYDRSKSAASSKP